jgi:hypothetical protein
MRTWVLVLSFALSSSAFSAKKNTIPDTKQFALKLTVAALNNDIKTLKTLLRRVPKNPKKRTRFDDFNLKRLLYMSGTGLNKKKCADKTAKFLMKNYNVRLNSFAGMNYKPEGLIYCGKTIVNSYKYFKNRDEIIGYINDEIVRVVRDYKGTKKEKSKLKKLAKPLSLVSQEAKRVCRKNPKKKFVCELRGQLSLMRQLFREELKLRKKKKS